MTDTEKKLLTNYQWPEHLYINDGETLGDTWLFTKEELEFAVEDLNKVCPPDDDFPPLTFEKAVYQEYDFEKTDQADPNTAYYSTWFCYTANGRTIKNLRILKVVGDGIGSWKEDQKNPNGSYYSCVDDDVEDENVREILNSYGKFPHSEEVETLKDFIDRVVRPIPPEELNQ